MNERKIHLRANLHSITRFLICLHLKALGQSVPETLNVPLIYENPSAGSAPLNLEYGHAFNLKRI